MQSIQSKYPITPDEYSKLDDKFGKLCHYASWQLDKKNTRNNHINDPEDTAQQLRMAMMKAGSYFKRQTYIEGSFEALDKHANDPFTKSIIKELKSLWKDRKRHGANRQKFGEHQEQILEMLLKKVVPKEDRPNKDANLKINSKFATYCKQIIWNEQKSQGKKITRDKGWRTGLVSLSEFDYLGVAV